MDQIHPTFQLHSCLVREKQEIMWQYPADTKFFNVESQRGNSYPTYDCWGRSTDYLDVLVKATYKGMYVPSITV